ncbi:MAG: cofactor-independent phosphoglycerate mutase [Magnetococcales bacterium]|uniref:Cofactor-independent phosphoglycerate mutase n=1 Tax=Candidatus Magnetobacterium casense TaxID=1455061 RepID=A0ABS6RUT2_9BACT|nr:cofactor-independent phosphoglycerate mutase [Candidatus Magnetobacterium casensis]MBF0606993.1 cofactor-independent phosphoglycerate mutase [Nitrospirota bacterium]MBV6340378.1 cofactor-independent phosphoglycerate mutase [Candidatus Magnetobacterium casensis]
MKYVVLIGDGMADRPNDALGGLTPLQKAATPNMDRLASTGEVGIVRTVPAGFPPGSDVANLCILGYDPAQYYCGRAPLEAASMGIALEPTDVAFRCNLVCLDFAHADGKDERWWSEKTLMEDYSSGHISTKEAGALIDSLNEKLADNRIKFYHGVSYRHLMLLKTKDDKEAQAYVNLNCTPPHDITGRAAPAFLPAGEANKLILETMYKSIDILREHPVNAQRRKEGKRIANSIWLWGQGRKPRMPLFREKYGIDGALISAVDLTRGLGVCAGFNIIKVPGVTGYLDTNYVGKATYGVDALRDVDFVYIHVEAPDEAGHSGKLDDKLKAIEDFDRLVVGNVMEGLKSLKDDYRVLLMPDHATPLSIRTHTDEPVPFVIYDSRHLKNTGNLSYDEGIATMKDIRAFHEGHRLMDYFINPQQ